ncbi:MAG: hypothetical protein ACI4D6_01520 [Chordicoccus sp.]
MREENDAGKTIVTTDDLTALFVRLGSDWTAREREAVRWKDQKGASHAEEMAGAFETMADCMDGMAQTDTAPAWTKAGAAAYLRRMADSCRKNAAGLREKMGDDFDLALLKDAEARAYRQAAWTLAGRPVRSDTPAVLRCCLIEPDAPLPRLFALGYCDDKPGELETAFRAFEAYYKISRENDRLLEAGGHTLLATSAGGDVPSVRGQDGEPLMYGKTLLFETNAQPWPFCYGLSYEVMRFLEEHIRRMPCSVPGKADGSSLVLDGARLLFEAEMET